MKKRLSVLMITKNAASIINDSLKSVQGLADEIILIDDYSKDQTVNIAKKYQAKIIIHKEYDLGKQKAFGLTYCRGEWVLILDSDEVVSEKLKKEINTIVNSQLLIKNRTNDGYYIKYQNYFLGRVLKYGGEDYKKLVLFRKEKEIIKPALIHEKAEVNGKVGILKNKILHYSYRSLFQLLKKFTSYAVRSARQKKIDGEKTSLKKIFLYPIHMFWARFIKDKGYKDGIFRLPLDIGFSYMEFLTYILLIFS